MFILMIFAILLLQGNIGTWESNGKLQNCKIITDYLFFNLNNIQNFSDLDTFVSFLEIYSELELRMIESDRRILEKTLSNFNSLNTRPLQSSYSNIRLDLKLMSMGGALKCQLSSQATLVKWWQTQKIQASTSKATLKIHEWKQLYEMCIKDLQFMAGSLSHKISFPSQVIKFLLDQSSSLYSRVTIWRMGTTELIPIKNLHLWCCPKILRDFRNLEDKTRPQAFFSYLRSIIDTDIRYRAESKGFVERSY